MKRIKSDQGRRPYFAGVLRAGFFWLPASVIFFSLCAFPVYADQTDASGQEKIVQSSDGKDIVITSYDPAPGAMRPTEKEKIRLKRIYSNWISTALSQWRRKEITASQEWPRMSPRELSKAYASYLRFLRNIEVESSSYLVLIPDENDRRKIIRRLINRTAAKIRSLQSGS